MPLLRHSVTHPLFVVVGLCGVDHAIACVQGIPLRNARTRRATPGRRRNPSEAFRRRCSILLFAYSLYYNLFDNTDITQPRSDGLPVDSSARQPFAVQMPGTGRKLYDTCQGLVAIS